MEEPGKAEFYIEVNAVDATEEEIDRMTRQLLSELRETDVESAELTKGGDAPRGTKAGEALTMGSLVISALPSVLPSVLTVVQSWIARGQGRTVKFKGKGIEFEGSPEDLHKLLATLEKRKRKK